MNQDGGKESTAEDEDDKKEEGEKKKKKKVSQQHSNQLALDTALALSSAATIPTDRCCPKSPVSVQEWVDSISLHKSEDDSQTGQGKFGSLDSSSSSSNNRSELDTLHLGAEAQHPHIKLEAAKDDGEVFHEEAKTATKSLSERRMSLLQMRNQHVSLQSNVSSHSTSSISSIETLLELRRGDPEEILLNLGFGGSAEPLDPLARIPKRFLKPSRVKGNDLEQFVRHQEELLETLDSGFCGYRGLSGFLKERNRPVGIVGKILDKIRETDRDIRRSSSSNDSNMSFSDVAFSILAVNAFRNSLLRNSAIRSPNFDSSNVTRKESILEPINREFLQSQREDSESKEEKSRLILGQDEFRLDGDGELVHSGKVTKPTVYRRLTALVLENEDVRTDYHTREVKTSSCSLWNVYREMSRRKIQSIERNVHDSDKYEEAKNTDNGDRILIRQNSICMDTNECLLPQGKSDDFDTRTQLTILSNDKFASTNKESFELEELPSHPDDGDEEGEGVDGAEGMDKENVLNRLDSAMSDSSGFLEGETIETPALEYARFPKVAGLPEETESDSSGSTQLLIRPEPTRPGGKDDEEFERQDEESTELNDVESEVPKIEMTSCVFRPISDTNETSASVMKGLQLFVCDQDNNISKVEIESPPNDQSFNASDLSESCGAGLTDLPSLVTCSDVNANSSQAEMMEEVPAEYSAKQRRRSFASTVKSRELVVSPQLSPRVSPVSWFQEEDEYHDLQQLLHIISNGEIRPKITREEFLSKPLKERARVEAIALQMALQKYYQTLNGEQSAMNRFKDQCDVDQKEELAALSQLHAGICHEVAQLQQLLQSRIRNIHKANMLPLSVRLIRQISLLLHQQKSLCQQLERIQMRDINKEEIADQLEIPEPDEGNKSTGDLKAKMQFVFKTFQDRLLYEVHKAVRQENDSLRRELENNRRELNEIKSLLKSMVRKELKADFVGR